MAERVFVSKLRNVGFEAVEILDRSQFSMEDATEYPLFTPDLVALMQRLLSPEQRREVATVVTLKACKAKHTSGWSAPNFAERRDTT